MRLILCLSILLLFSCEKPLSPEEIYNKYSNNVVLIQNKYYYEIIFDTETGFEHGKFIYYSVNNEGALSDKKLDAVLYPFISYGTGFIINSQGDIISNKHVISPSIDEDLYKNIIKENLNKIQKLINDSVLIYESEINRITDLYERNKYYLSTKDIVALNNLYKYCNTKIVSFEKAINSIEYSPDKLTFNLHLISTGIAYNDTYVESTSDFVECIVKNVSNDEDIDLGTIQLKSKQVPESIKFTPKLEVDKKHQIKINDPVYMIGFNNGISLAQTKEGIKSQLTEGKISQEPTSNKLLYSIPTLRGSSGSPIIDQWGNIVAVNYAKMSEDQGFCFGVPIQELINYINQNQNQ